MLSRLRLVPTTVALGALLGASLAVGSAPPASAGGAADVQVTSRASVTTVGLQTTGSSDESDMSDDGRWVVFASTSKGLVAGYNPTQRNIYLSDRITGQVSLVSVPLTGSQPSGESEHPRVSNDGRYVVFESAANNLVTGPPQSFRQVYRRDLWLGTTRLVSRKPAGGAAGNASSTRPDLSADGARVVFESQASNLANPDVLGHTDVFVWTAPNDSLVRLSSSPTFVEANGDSSAPSISGDGTTVGFQSTATNLLPVADTSTSDVFVRPIGGATSKVSVPKVGLLANSDSYAPRLSADGTRVAFDSVASNLVTGDSNMSTDAFLRDRTTGTTTRVSLNVFGGQLASGGLTSAVDALGTHVLFRTFDADVTAPPSDGNLHLWLRDIAANKQEEIDMRDDTATHGTGDAFGGAISGDDRYVAFDSSSHDLVRNDTNAQNDVFVRDRFLPIWPFDTWDQLIDQQHVDFLGRHATANEIAVAKARITNGEDTVGRFITAMAHRVVWSGQRAPLLRLYWAFFLRAPDAGGLDHWLDKYRTGTPLVSIAGSFATSQEFKSTYGPLVDADFVNLVYGNVLQRKSDANGVAYWVDQLQHHGLTRGAMMGKFSESPEGRGVLAPYVDVLLVYTGMLRVIPDHAEFIKLTNAVIANSKPVPGLADDMRVDMPYAARF